jgi:hypothetical protein
MEQLGSHWMDFHKNLYLSIFQKFVEKIRVFFLYIGQESFSLLARQPLVGPGLLKKLCPFVTVEGDLLPVLDYRTKITGTVHEDQYTYLTISYSFLLRMRNVSDKRWRENKNTHSVFSSPPPPPNRAVYNVE